MRGWIRRIVLAVGVVVAIVVLALIAVLTVDLGPALRERAEVAGSRLIERPVHIGRLGIRLRSGTFVVENVRIDGLTPSDRPFFTAKRIEVSLPWWTFLGTRDVLIESIDMSDWDMQVELMEDGRNNFIKRLKASPGAKRSYTVTLESVHAYRGRFTYIDHGTWRTVAPNLDITMKRSRGQYQGRMQFSGGTVAIKDFVPFRSDMRCSFRLDGGSLHLNWIDLTTDGSHSVVIGDVDFLHWPEMIYRVRTDRIDFPRMREIFFADEDFRVGGQGKFNGTFHVYKGGPDLKGSFSSPLLTVNDFRFPDLSGDLRWLPNRFDITNGAARFHDGTGRFTYAMAPLGTPQPAVARFDTSYDNVDLASFTDFLKTRGLRLAGRASGRNILEWPLGRFSEHRGEGQITVRAPVDARLYSPTSAPLPQWKPGGSAPPPPNVGTVPNLGYLPIAGTLRYQYDPEWVTVGASSIATPATYLEFSGRTAYGERSSLDFYARSGDWQESDKLLAAVITAFGSPTRSVALGGYGEFTGRMLNSFKRPRIEGAFTGEQVRAFDVVWGKARGSVVVDDGYVDVASGIVTQGSAAEARVDGRFSLSTPRDDGGEEINTRVLLKDWPIPDLRHAFDLDAYPIEGKMGGEYHIYGTYPRPFGSGTIRVTDASAYAEPFERGTGSLRLEGTGARIDGIEITKGGGTIKGAAYVSWDGRYSFDANGRGIPVEQVAALKFPGTPLFGVLSFSVNGSGSFANPRYVVKNIRIADLFVGDEGIGQVTGELYVRDQILAFDLDAASPRLSVWGAGQISLAPGANAAMWFHLADTSLDPYIRAFEPRLSPFTKAIGSGTVRVSGRLTDMEHLLVEASVEQLEMRLFDYRITNAAGHSLQIVLDNNVIHLFGRPSGPGVGAMAAGGAREPVRLAGEDTSLQLSGDVNLRDQRVAVNAVGDANLGILQGLFRDIRSSGSAQVRAAIQGPLGEPVFTGTATVQNGRIRYFSLPHSIDAINGPITFTVGAIRFGGAGGDLTAQIGGGPVTFGGSIQLNGFMPSQWAVTASAANVHVRYPEGFNSVVDGELNLTGPYASPTLQGMVTVRSALYSKPLEITPFALAAAAAGSSGTPSASALAFPLRFDIRILAPSTLRLENNLGRMVANADLTLQGTYDHPLLLGQAEVERGYLTMEGKRYTFTHGAIEFNNPARIDPVFDFETETRVRVPGQSYFVNLHIVGSMKRLDIQLTSDPPLPQPEIASLLLGDIRNPEDVRNAELAALQRPGAATQDVLGARIEQLILSPGTIALNRAFEKAFLLDTFQLTPSLFNEYQRWSPTARVTIGKQISNRAYLTISRSLYAPQEDIIYLLEYDQTDRVSWVLSRNEDKTYALDVRVRHSF